MNDSIFGIDFGTTYTVISYFDNSNLKFVKFNRSVLIPTEIDGINNIKRLLGENPSVENYAIVEKFFLKIGRILENFPFNHKNCVLTVPVRFNDIARNAIKIAAIRAGFNVLKLLSEPVAAAIFCVQGKKNGYYLVYDLGGGTFDATLLNFQDGVFQILAIDGLSDFGGIDIDQIISDYFHIDLTSARLYKEKSFYEGNEIPKICSEAIKNALIKTYRIIFSLLEQNNVEINNVTQLILAGGSTKIHYIYDELSKFFAISSDYDADKIVSAGAAKYGQILSQQNSDYMLIDVLPFDFGIETFDGSFEILIPRNSPLPASAKMLFKQINNAPVLINILQGLSTKAVNCELLASFVIQEKLSTFEVMFMVDYDGILSVKVGNYVKIVSAKNFIHKQLKAKFIKIYDKILELKKNNILTNEQEKFVFYLKQAINCEVTKSAKQWLIKQYAVLFKNKLHKKSDNF